jgi:hypothetical protein
MGSHVTCSIKLLCKIVKMSFHVPSTTWPFTCMVIDRCKVQGPAFLLQLPSVCWFMTPKVLGHLLSWWLVLHFPRAPVW